MPSVENTAEPALPGRRCCPLEGVTPQAARGWDKFSGAGVGQASQRFLRL